MSAELIPADRMAVTIAEAARMTTLSPGLGPKSR